MNLKEYSLEEALIHFPNITRLESFGEFKNKNFDFYLTALGFEERTLSLPENFAILSQEDGFTCDESIYFTYETSTNDNAFNEPRLKAALELIKNERGDKAVVSNMFCDEDLFSEFLHEKLNNKIKEKNGLSIDIIIDLSVCSSKLILTLLKIVFEIKRINLIILYTEARIYYPLFEEFIMNKEKFLEDSELSTTSGYETIVNSNEYSEGTKESPDLIVAFAPFKAGRINKIVSDIDESILLNNDKRLIWIIGSPNFSNDNDKRNRISMLKEINGVNEDPSNKIFEVSTLDYKETILRLENIYLANFNYHINIADLGSKMQTLAISIYYHIRPDVSVYYALPKEYNSNRYSQGVKCHWKIDFRDFNEFITQMESIDRFEIEYKQDSKYPFFE